MPDIQLLDGKKIPFTKSISGFDLIKKISKSLEKSALIMEVNGSLRNITAVNIPQYGAEAKMSWARVAPICWAPAIYKTMEAP